MPDPTQPLAVLKPDELTARLMADRAAQAENYLRGEASEQCARFYTLIEGLSQSHEMMDLAAAGYQAQATGAGSMDEIIHGINDTRKAVQALAAIVGGLDSGEYELIAWRRESYPPDQIMIGVWKAGRLRRDAPTVEWIIVPLLFMFGAAAIAGAVTAALMASARKTAAQADFLRAQTEQGIVQMIAQAPPDQREALTAQFERIQAASIEASKARGAGEPGWLGTFGKAAGKLLTGAVDAAAGLVSSGALPWAILAFVVVFGLGSRDRSTRAA